MLFSVTHSQGLVGNYQPSSFVTSQGFYLNHMSGISYINLVFWPPTSSLLGKPLSMLIGCAVGVEEMKGPDILPVAEMDLQRWPPPFAAGEGDSSLCDGPALQGCCMLIWPIVSGWLLFQCFRTKDLCVDLCFALFNKNIWIFACLHHRDIKAGVRKGILLSAFDGRIFRRDLCRCCEVFTAAFFLVPGAMLAEYDLLYIHVVYRTRKNCFGLFNKPMNWIKCEVYVILLFFV